MSKPPVSVMIHFSNLSDPRVAGRTTHKLLDIIGILIAGTICGAEGWEEFEDFAEGRFDWLSTRLDLENGPPSADTIRRVVERLNPSEFEKSFSSWVNSLAKGSGQKIVAIDGKSVRNSDPLTLVSAWTNANNGLCLGQTATDKKSNEVKAIPRLLSLLDLKGALVTIDAAGCQKKIAEKIVKENKADYVLAVKANQPTLYQSIIELFDQNAHLIGVPTAQRRTLDQKRGREEIRRFHVCKDIDWLHEVCPGWETIRAVGMVDTTVHSSKDSSTNRRYYIMSRELDTKTFAECVRGHWGIENRLHWVLDVVFKEDATPIKSRRSNRIIGLIKRMSLNALTQNKTRKSDTIRRMRRRCNWSDQMLEKVLSSGGF